MARLRYNGLSTTLGASLTSSATSVTFAAALTHSNGTSVPTITGSDFIPLAILDSSGHLSEIVYLTAYTAAATTGTITRGQEGTTGVSHASGDKVAQATLVADTWEHPIDNLPLTTLTGWTAGSGTWTASAAGIRNADTGAAAHRLRYTAAPIPQGECVAEMDINIASLTQGVNSRAGFLLGYPIGSDTTGSILCCLRGNAGNTAITQVYLEFEGVTAGPATNLASSISTGVWTTFRAHKVGPETTVWVNGTLIGTYHINQTSNVDVSTLAFYSWGTDVQFRNLDVWTPPLPF